MPHSYAETLTLNCAACGRDFDAQFWLVVDTAERPDLLERIRAGDLHELACPHCGDAGHMDAPLLLFQPDGDPILLFSPAEETSAEEDREQARQLVELLQEALGNDWQDDWLAEGLRSVPRALLPIQLSDDPEGAMAQMVERAAAELARLQEEDPQRFAEMQAAMRSMAKEAAPLLPLIEQFIQAETWDQTRRVVEQHPELLSDEADRLMATLIEAARVQGDDQAVQMFDEHRNLLRRCREAGVARAFAEQMLEPDVLAEIEAAGLTPEQVIEAQQAAAEMPPELKAILAELAASGVELRSPQDLEAFLASRPDLAARLEAVAQAMGMGGGPGVPPQFQADLQQAQQAEQRYLRTGDRSALDAAAAAWLRIIDNPAFADSQDPFQLAAMNSAGGVLLRRYWSAGRLADLTRALELWQSAVQRTPPDSPDLPMYLNNLGNGLSDRYARTGSLADLEEAIRVYQSAVQRTPPDSPDLPSRLNNLGNGLSARYARTGSLADLEEARERHRVACRRGLEVTPEEALRSARNWGNWALERREWAEATEAYGYGRRAINGLFTTQTSRAAKEAWLKEAQGLPANAAYALARLGKLEEAVVALEAGRARLLAEALEQNRRDLEQLDVVGHGDLLARYRAAAQQVTALQQQAARPTSQSTNLPTYHSDHTAWRQQLEQARAELDAAIAAIRQVPGYQDFFLPPTFAKIQQAATPDAPLVYLATTPVGSVALVVRSEQTPSAASGQALRISANHDSPASDDSPPDHDQPRRVSAVWLDGLTEAGLLAAIVGPADDPALGGYLGAYDGWRRNPRSPAARDRWHTALDQTTRWLWDSLMGDVVRALTAQGYQRAVLVPTGLLGLLPLHAASTEDATRPTGRRYALDALALSYAPNVGALAAGQETAARVRPDGVLAVDNPDGSLLFSAHEVEAVLSYFPSGHGKALRGSAAIRVAVLDQLTNFPIYHLSTHGWAGWDEPLQGGLLLAGGQRLTLADILDLRLAGARLAVLSACETGIPGVKVPDEVVSLPTGLVQAGVAGVVASLWAVNDLSTAMLMERFYRLWREDGLPPAEALRQAQIWLRDSTNREKAEYFRRDVPALAGVRMPEMVAAELYVERMLQPDGDARQFAHPFHWAAFSMTGA